MTIYIFFYNHFSVYTDWKMLEKKNVLKVYTLFDEKKNNVF